ncbi:MAG TPA: iron ABC transporter permease [Stellaceae bacterium]|nr:iron ABC transporter permease [Stellaceae bacterium]
MPGESGRRANPWPAVMIGAVIAASAIIIVMLIVVLWLGFRVGDVGDPAARYSLGNYRDMFGDPMTYAVLADSFGFALVTLAVSLAFGVPLAWLVERTDLKAKTAVFTMMTVGLLLPGFASAMGWLFLMHPRIGMVNTGLMRAFGLSGPVFNIASVAGMGWVQGLNLAPVSFIMTAAVFRAMDPALEEAAQVAGAGFGRTMRAVTLRLAWPGILAASIYVFTIGFAAFDVPAIIGWGNRLFTFSTYLVVQLDSTRGLPQYGLAAALSSFLVAIGVILSWWYSRIQRRAERYQVVTGKAYRPRIVALGRWQMPAWGFAAIYFLLSQVVPLLLVAWASLLPYFQLPTAAAFATVSLQQYRSLPWQLAGEGIVNTAILMVLTPTATLALSVAFSWVVLRSRIPGRSGFDVIAFLPHAVPNIVFGVSALLIALFVLGAAVPLFGTVSILLVVFVVARLSYGTRMTNSGLIQIHRELEEAATVSGAGTGTVLGRVLGPLLAPTLLYAWLWIALLAFRELTLAIVLTTRQNITLPVVVWSLWLNGGLAQASALALIMLLIMMPVVVLYWYVVRRRGILAAG